MAATLDNQSIIYTSTAIKVLQKYIRLLIKYYRAVQRQKVAKKIPASTAMK